MINTHLLKLPLKLAYIHGSEGVQAIEVRLYKQMDWTTRSSKISYGPVLPVS